MIDRELTAEEIRVLSEMMYDKTIAQINKLTTIKENTMEDWTPKEGELVLVRDYDDQEWSIRKYITTTKLGKEPYIVMNDYEDCPIAFRQMKSIEKTLTVELTEADAGFIMSAMRGHLHNQDWTPAAFHCMKGIHDSILDKINAAK